MSSDAPCDHPCLRVFAIPELAGLICALVPKSTNARLLRTCRSLFREIRQYVWESTDAVVTIISMIPCGWIVESGDELPFPYWVMSFPTPLDLSRLSIYSPFIKNLEIPIGRRPININGYENWGDFLVCTRSTPLLPNLEHIQVSISVAVEGARITGDSANLIFALLSPSLLSFGLVRHNSWDWTYDRVDYMFTDLKLTHKFLDEVSQRSPRIELLEIFPADFDWVKYPANRGYTRKEIRNLNYSSPSSKACTAISQFQRLRTLSTTPFFLDNDMLLSLAQLPLLESLSIHNLSGSHKVYATDLQLPDQSFPSLRHFKIGSVTWDTIKNLLRQKSIWRGIHTVHIRGFEVHPAALEPQDDPHIWSSIVPSLADHGSTLTSLDLSGAHRQIVTPRLVDSLKRLPLTTLLLPSLDGDRPDWINIVHGLPLIENLTIDLYLGGISASGLCRIFASMPRLAYLSLPTSTEFVDEIRTAVIPQQPYSLANVHFETNFHLAKEPREDAEAVARFLYALRPNMTYGPGSYTPAWYQGYHWENPMNTVIINETLSRLREGLWVDYALSVW